MRPQELNSVAARQGPGHNNRHTYGPGAILGLCVRDLRPRMAIAQPCSHLETCTC